MADEARAPYTVMVTGARPKDLFGYRNPAAYVPLQQALEAFCIDAVDRAGGDVRFVSGGAQGVDQMFFWAVEAAKEVRPDAHIENVLAIPFPGQANHWMEKGMFGQQEYRCMLARADEKVVCGQDADEYKAIAAALHHRNAVMVGLADECLAVYAHDEPWQEARGGTASAMRKAAAKGIPVRMMTRDGADAGWVANYDGKGGLYGR